MEDGYLNVRKAAAYVGYELGVDEAGKPLPLGKDKAALAFYAWVRRNHVAHKRRGRSGMLFTTRALDRALETCSAEQQDRFERMETLAHSHARGEVRPS